MHPACRILGTNSHKTARGLPTNKGPGPCSRALTSFQATDLDTYPFPKGPNYAHALALDVYLFDVCELNAWTLVGLLQDSQEPAGASQANENTTGPSCCDASVP